MVFTDLQRWLYSGKHPNGIAKFLNRLSASLYGLGIAPNYLGTLEVVGRKSGKVVSLPVVIAVINGERYLVSMLGEEANWVQNVRAAQGKAVLRSAGRESIVLEDVPVEQRAPIIKAYLQRAPGARPHIRVNKDAPLVEFEQIAPTIPVFHIRPVG